MPIAPVGSPAHHLEAWIAALDVDDVAAEVAASTGQDVDDARHRLDRYLNESRVGLRVVTPHLAPERRLLEVGSGIGVVARVLHSLGHDVVELEPVGIGFAFIAATRAALQRRLPGGPRHLDLGVDELDPAVHGCFDTIYSLNVLEHVPSPTSALGAMYRVLAPSGSMVLSCPNYAVPYEPHFAIPLVPGRPAATARILPSHITSSDLWASLNWVNHGDVTRWADASGAAVTFRVGRLADALERLAVDDQFASRHAGAIGRAAKALRRTGLISAVRALPPRWSSPMEFVVRRPSER